METKYNSPSDSVAAKALVKTQTGITRIKEIITLARIRGWSDGELTKRLNKAISDCCNGFDNAFLKEAVRKSLVNSARKWNWLLKNSIEVYNKNLLQKAKLDDFNYTVDVSALMKGKEGVTRKEFRNTLNTGTVLGKPLIRDYRRSVTIALRALSAEPPLVAQMKDGKVRKMSLRNVAEMTVRHEASLHDIEKMRAKGVTYVWTTSHPNCSPRCAKFQGKLWSLNNTSGTLEGNKYRPIEIALNGLLHDGNGIISGYNCRHRLVVWFTGSKSPVEYTEAEIKKAYAIDQKQRAYENNIRRMKLEEKLMRAAGDEEYAIVLWKKWRTATQDYKLYSLENNRPYYMYRCMVDEMEIDAAKNTLTEQAEFDILNAQSALAEGTELKPNSSNRAVRLWYINEVKGIHDKIDQSLPMEDKAKLAFDLRNDMRSKAREAMGDVTKRKELDLRKPNPTFEEKIEAKMKRKHITRNEAIEDIYKTACTTNKKINKELGIDE